MSRPLLSVIIAAYNVDSYIEATLKSIDRQSIDLSRVEFIIIDDGSTDRTALIADEWAQSRSNVILQSQKNQGVAGARQSALGLAHGEWITSVDPDDLVDKDYFKSIFDFLERNSRDELQMIVTNLISLNSLNGRLTNNHALRHRFDRGDRIADLSEEPQNIQLGATALLRLDLIREFSLKYDALVRPTFEDAHFIGRYLSHFNRPRIGIVASAKYYYRKRSDRSSLVQSSWNSRDRYTTVLERGYLDLLLSSRKVAGKVPNWIQNMVLYDLFWYFLEDTKQFSRTAWIDSVTRDRFMVLLELIFVNIDVEVISTFNIYPVPLHIRHAVITRFKGLSQTVVHHAPHDDGTHDLTLFFAFDFSDKLVQTPDNSILHSFFGLPFCREFYFRNISTLDDQSKLSLDHIEEFPGPSFYSGGIQYFIPRFDHSSSRKNPVEQILSFSSKLIRAREIFALRRLATGQNVCSSYKFAGLSLLKKTENFVSSRLSRRHRISLIKKAKSPESVRVYGEAWCLLDRPNKADDNAEHLYRYLSNTHPDINAFFIINKNSPDWPRLQREGFRLLEPHSDELSIAILNAKYIISSDAVAECMYPVHRSLINRNKVPFVFLQHGVLMNDLSRWLNPKKIDHMFTSSIKEFVAVTGPDSPYAIEPKNVHLSGLSRFDALVSLRRRLKNNDRDIILVMPTWRHSLTESLVVAASPAEKEHIIASSDFFVSWNSLLSDDRFSNLLVRKKMRVVFVPHPSLRPFSDLLKFPSHVEVADLDSSSLQEYLAKSVILLTDYSSITFDAAYINVPSIYFQFDHDSIFGGSHNFRPGYFSYKSDGFGPVVDRAADAISMINAELSDNRISKEYGSRIASTFPTIDVENSSRIVKTLNGGLDDIK